MLSGMFVYNRMLSGMFVYNHMLSGKLLKLEKNEAIRFLPVSM